MAKAVSSPEEQQSVEQNINSSERSAEASLVPDLV